MAEKKSEHDELQQTHIYRLWDRDLDAFLEALAKQEEKDERDRLAHKGLKNEGKRKRVAAKKKEKANSEGKSPNKGKPVKKAQQPPV